VSGESNRSEMGLQIYCRWRSNRQGYKAGAMLEGMDDIEEYALPLSLISHSTRSGRRRWLQHDGQRLLYQANLCLASCCNSTTGMCFLVSLIVVLVQGGARRGWVGVVSITEAEMLSLSLDRSLSHCSYSCL
jgi:hypothetical protein